MIFRKDNFVLGLVLGLIGPVLGLVIIYFFKFPSLSFSEFVDYFLNDNRLITSIGALALLVNAVVFAIYVHYNKYQTFKGIFLATVVYGIGILILKIFN